MRPQPAPGVELVPDELYLNNKHSSTIPVSEAVVFQIQTLKAGTFVECLTNSNRAEHYCNIPI
ncbi:MAG: hypothetical protein JWQ09_3075 [Segetibacter sp.]|nr:hypothetical protein [Segetibacter sp.]